MISFTNGGRLVQNVSELPSLDNITNLYLDVETSGLNAYKGDRICGFAITMDDAPGAWYIPTRCTHGGNLSPETWRPFLRDAVRKAKRWINHNVKFDAHFCAVDGADFDCELVCTLTSAKMLDSDRGFDGHTYSLDSLSNDWLEENINAYENRLKAYLPKDGSYANIPADILGEYACQDVLTNRKLHDYISRRMPADMSRIWEIERKITAVLFDIERDGMFVDPLQLQVQEMVALHTLMQIEEELTKLTGSIINPTSNTHCYELLCGRFGLPVVSWTDAGDPSFDKDALASYLQYPDVLSNEKLTSIVQLILKYRKTNTLLTMFIRPFQEYEFNGVMHPNYNQLVRTGRMSCSRPNAQQNSYESKELILPGEGNGLLVYDYSQIEFRGIVHYIRDAKAIAAYNEDPDTDFHQFTADECQIPRKPAKNINFAVGYGAGKRKMISMLSSVPEFVNEMSELVDVLISEGKVHQSRRKQALDMLCQRRGEQVYNTYHKRFASLRETSRRAEATARAKGYVKTIGGRRRHLGVKFAHKAFNSVVQGGAADIMKERLIAVSPRFNSTIRGAGLQINAVVHDEVGFRGPREVVEDQSMRCYIRDILETPEFALRVPIRVSCGYSETNWAIAGSDEGRVCLPR